MLLYKTERDNDFFEVCLLVQKELYKKKENSSLNRRGYFISPREIYTTAILQPAKSFYLADARQILKIYKKAKSLTQISTTPRGALYRDICDEFLRLEALHPGMSSIQIAQMIENSPAPRFYISDSWAKIIFYKQLKKYHGKKQSKGRRCV